MIGNWQEWEPDPTNVAEPYQGQTVSPEPSTDPWAVDPYRRCEAGSCYHDLARGITKTALLGGDGPYPDNYPLQPPLGAGGILNGLRRAMPNMPHT